MFAERTWSELRNAGQDRVHTDRRTEEAGEGPGTEETGSDVHLLEAFLFQVLKEQVKWQMTNKNPY